MRQLLYALPRPHLPISIHAPRVGCDHRTQASIKADYQFQSTHPVWGATEQVKQLLLKKGISLHAPRVGCDLCKTSNRRKHHISIHAPRVGCDGQYLHAARLPALFQSTHPVWGATPSIWGPPDRVAISIHAPRVGCDGQYLHAARLPALFQSTHPVWGATWPFVRPDLLQSPDFNPRTPCGVRRGRTLVYLVFRYISIHAPRVGCDLKAYFSLPKDIRFQSTHPVWGATLALARWPTTHREFQSTHPVWGATGCSMCGFGIHLEFQSTHPVWGATGNVPDGHLLALDISIHAPRVGCDRVKPLPSVRTWAFQSTHPVWGATLDGQELPGQFLFQSTHPVWGATVSANLRCWESLNFNPRTPCGVRHAGRAAHQK